MSLKDEINNQTGSSKNVKPVTPLVNRRNRAGECVGDPWFESPHHKRTERERYEACWKECVAMDLTAQESTILRRQYAQYYERSYPERVLNAGTLDEPGTYRGLLKDPASVVDVSDEKRRREFTGFKLDSLRTPPEAPVTPQEIVGKVNLKPGYVPPSEDVPEDMPF